MNLFACILKLFLIQDPIGNIPVFLSLLSTVHSKRRVWIIIREHLIALLISSTFLISGKTILTYLQIDPSSLGIAGGLILLVIAFDMLFPKDNKVSTPLNNEEPFIIPLAMPLLAGPSIIATVTLYAAQYPKALLLCFFALVIVTALSTTILLLALPLYEWFSPQALKALERLVAIILIAMAIEMILSNLFTYPQLFKLK